MMACVTVGTAASIGLDLAKRNAAHDSGAHTTPAGNYTPPTNASRFHGRLPTLPAFVRSNEKFTTASLPGM